MGGMKDVGLPIKKADHKFTYEEYSRWPDDERWELIDGVAYNMSPAPSIDHQRASRKLATAIDRSLEGGPCELFSAPFDIFFPEFEGQTLSEISTVVQPDISVICDSDKLIKQGCVGAPDVVVEILSPWTTKKDLSEKFHLYEASGVREYWIVDSGNTYFRIFHLQEDGAYDFGSLFEAEGVVSSSVLVGFKVAVEDIL